MRALAAAVLLAAGCGKAYEAVSRPDGGATVRGARYTVDLPKGWELEGDARDWGATKGECQLLVNGGSSTLLRLIGSEPMLNQARMTKLLVAEGVAAASVRCEDAPGERGGGACVGDAQEKGVPMKARIVGHSTSSSHDVLLMFWPAAKPAECGQDQIAASFRRNG